MNHTPILQKKEKIERWQACVSTGTWRLLPLISLRIEAVPIDAKLPFSQLFALWLSIMQAVELASRPPFSQLMTESALS